MARTRSDTTVIPGGPARRRRPRSRAGLSRLFDGPVPAEELATWSVMDERQRAAAIQRGVALLRWMGDELSAGDAAVKAGVELTRFYQMGVAWRRSPSLASLGVDAVPAARRRSQFKPEVNQAMQSAVVEIVEAHGTSSVRSLAHRLRDALAERTGESPNDLPSYNTLRAAVEREIRRRARERAVGNELVFDHSAVGMLRGDGSVYTMFAVADRASQVILGAALGAAGGEVLGYRAAVVDFARRLAAGRYERATWSDVISRIVVVPGVGGRGPLEGLAAAVAGSGIGLSWTAPGDEGRHLRRLAGSAIDVLPLWPARTGVGGPPPSLLGRTPRLDADVADARLALAVDRYDDELLSSCGDGGGSDPPPDLRELLRALSRSSTWTV